MCSVYPLGKKVDSKWISVVEMCIVLKNNKIEDNKRERLGTFFIWICFFYELYSCEIFHDNKLFETKQTTVEEHSFKI